MRRNLYRITLSKKISIYVVLFVGFLGGPWTGVMQVMRPTMNNGSGVG